MDCELPSYFSPLPTADCLLNLRGVRVGGTLGQYRSIRQDVTLSGKEETLVTLKMNDRRGNVIENKGSWSEAAERSGNAVDSKVDTSRKRECC